MIELIVLDIDGVITDGSVIVDSSGREQKQINLRTLTLFLNSIGVAISWRLLRVRIQRS